MENTPATPTPHVHHGQTKAVTTGIWISTGLFAVMFAFSGAMFIAAETPKEDQS